jgi:pseudouridine-5'-phosphate glycosidase
LLLLITYLDPFQIQGMPWPQNLEAALAVEATVRTGGAVPATVGVIDGVPVVGLDEKQLETMARGGSDVSPFLDYVLCSC